MDPAGGRAERAAAAAQVLVGDPDHPDLDPADRHHLARVLRLRPAETVVATDGRGRWSLCAVHGAGDRLGLTPTGPSRLEAAPAPALTVAFAPVKGERPDWAVQKLTELGIDRIVVLRTARGVVRWEGGGGGVERLRRVAVQAAAQCRRVHLPEVAGPLALGELDPDRLALAQPDGAPPSLGRPWVAVGPEGGWTPDELAGAATVALGPLVLRTETAAVAAGVLLAALRAGTVAESGRPG